MMQAAVALSAVLPVALRCRPAARRSSRATVAGGRRIVGGGGVRASAAAAPEADYSSNVSVFPMEACDLVGGEACDAQMYPETKLGGGAAAAAVARAPEVEREYLAYDEPKTVFPDEACDDLGGEFCEAPYQTSK
ncbi:hypothetical protein ZWY2020_032069 [Hordeum vulgare]|nr:hypothetical protein ZWY2020_032069 [Hordeum vulgare]